MTLLALGNGSPDIFAQVAAANNGVFSTAMGTMLGASISKVYYSRGLESTNAIFRLESVRVHGGSGSDHIGLEECGDRYTKTLH